jgi:acetylornithine aminotransferase
VHCTEPVGPLVEAARERGLLVIPAGEGDVLRMVPPLVVSEAEVAEAVGTLQECFQEWQ